MTYVQGLNPNMPSLQSLFSGKEGGDSKTEGTSGDRQTRTVSPFDDSGGPSFVSLRSQPNEEGGLNSEVLSLLQQILSILSEQAGGASGGDKASGSNGGDTKTKGSDDSTKSGENGDINSQILSLLQQILSILSGQAGGASGGDKASGSNGGDNKESSCANGDNKTNGSDDSTKSGEEGDLNSQVLALLQQILSILSGQGNNQLSQFQNQNNAI